MHITIRFLCCAALFAVFTPTASADIGDRTFVIKRGGDSVIINPNRSGTYNQGLSELRTISGVIKRVGHDSLSVETAEGRVSVDLDEIDFGADIDNVFLKDTTVTVRGLRERGDDMKALWLKYSRNGKSYTYKTTNPRYTRNLY